MKSLLPFFALFAATSVVASDSFLRATQDIPPEEDLDDANEKKAFTPWDRALQGTARRLHGVWYWFEVSRPVRAVPVVSRPEDVVDAAIDSDLSTLVDLLIAADLVETLRSEGPWTLMAPTNSAFKALPAETVSALKANSTLLANVLLYHVLPNQEVRTIGNSWRSGGPFPTAATGGPTLTTSRYRAGRRGPLVKKVNNARVLGADIIADNGVLHIIDSVLLPPDEGTSDSEEPFLTTTKQPVASPAGTSPGAAATPSPAPGPGGAATTGPAPADAATTGPAPADAATTGPAPADAATTGPAPADAATTAPAPADAATTAPAA